MKRIVVFIVTMTMLISFCACAPTTTEETPSSQPTIKATQTPTPTPSPTPMPVPTEEEIISDFISLDPTAYISANSYEKGDEAYNNITQNPEIALGLQTSYSEWLSDCEKGFSNPLISSLKVNSQLPDMQILTTLAYQFSDDEDSLKNALISLSDYSVELKLSDDTKTYEAVLNIEPKDSYEYFYSLPETQTVKPLHNTLFYAYLKTLYDDNLASVSEIENPPLEPLLFPIADAENYYVGDTWGDSRDAGTRQHTGTDINAPEGTDLYACVDGEIIDVGDSAGTGYYVVLRGADGTQYHYYHLVTPSPLNVGTEVLAGDVVGYGGNTGNSTANHLHLTMVLADGKYANPYIYLKEAHERALNLE